MTDEYDWVADLLAVLDRDPLRIDPANITPAEVAELRERIEALLELHGCEPTLEGWREIAIRLAFDHVRALRVIVPGMKDPKRPGRPRARQQSFGKVSGIAWVLDRSRFATVKAFAEAEERAGKETHGLKAKTIRNVVTAERLGKLPNALNFAEIDARDLLLSIAERVGDPGN